jgi:hypothetical protein
MRLPGGRGLGHDPPRGVALGDHRQGRAAAERRAHQEDLGRAVAVEIGEARLEILEHGAFAGGKGPRVDRNGAGLRADPGKTLPLLNHEAAGLDPVAQGAVTVFRARLGEEGRERSLGLPTREGDCVPRRLGDGRLIPGRDRERRRLHPAADQRDHRSAHPAPRGGVRTGGKRAFPDDGLRRGQRPREVGCGAAELGDGEGQREDLDAGLRPGGRWRERNGQQSGGPASPATSPARHAARR